jgi:hypothetical protein
MAEKESTSEQLRREAQKLRETAIDLMEYAARLINKSIDLDNEIAKNAKKTQGLVKWPRRDTFTLLWKPEERLNRGWKEKAYAKGGRGIGKSSFPPWPMPARVGENAATI